MNSSFLQHADQVLRIESEALNDLRLNLLSEQGNAFTAACQTLLACSGHVIVMGMGKSGHIASKIAASLASTGTPSFFIHPAEALHGDLGMITASDCVLALSYSGESEEILRLLPILKRQGNPILCMTGKAQSSMAQYADVHLCVPIKREACPLNLAPTSSSTAMLALGDALTVALLSEQGFTAEDFARSHPGGKLGRRLITRVADIMHCGEELPVCAPDTLLREAIFAITAKQLGVTFVCDDEQRLLGVFTDGDLRRSFERQPDALNTHIAEFMTPHPKSVAPQLLAVEALNLLERHKISVLAVVEGERLIGAVHLLDILKAGVS